MTERRSIILNSLLTLILIASIYQFTRSESLTEEVGVIDRNTQHAQRQIADLKEAASSTFEQTMRRFDDFSRQLSRLAPAPRRSASAKSGGVAAVPEQTSTATASNGLPGATAPSNTALPRSTPRISRRTLAVAGHSRTVCDFPCYRTMLLPLLGKIVESAGYKVVRDSGVASAQSLNAAIASAQIPYDQRKAQEDKLDKDLLEFLQMRARICDAGSPGNPEDKPARCEARARQLADQGNAAAQRWLGTDARDKQNLQMAVSWLEQAADQGDIGAMNDLGAIYAGSIRQVDPTVAAALIDPMKAFSWYSKSVGLGDANAMGAIAVIYQEGQLIPQDQREAIVWYEMAAKAITPAIRGRALSANFAGALGDIYCKGAGVELDKIRAYQWYAVACADAPRLNLASDSTCASRNSLASELNPIEVAKAQALAAEWLKLHR